MRKIILGTHNITDNTFNTKESLTMATKKSLKIVEAVALTGTLLLYNSKILMKATMNYKMDLAPSQSVSPFPTRQLSTTSARRPNTRTMIILPRQLFIKKVLT